MATLTFDFPEKTPNQLTARRRREGGKLAAAIEWYRRSLLSQGRATEMVGFPRADLIDELVRPKVEVLRVIPEELNAEAGNPEVLRA